MSEKQVYRCELVDDGDSDSLIRVFFISASDRADARVTLDRLFPASRVTEIMLRDEWVAVQLQMAVTAMTEM